MTQSRPALAPQHVAVATAASLLLAALLVLSSGTAQAAASGPCGAQEAEVDILFAFDVSASMTEELDDVKRASQELLDNLTAEVPQARIGLASFSDYPGRFTYLGYDAYYGYTWSTGTDYPWRLDHDLTNDTTAIAQAIQDLKLLKGGDIPESYSRVLLEATELSSWRSNALPILVVWGDSYPHDDDLFDQTFGLDPGRDATARTADDLDLQQTLQGFVDRGGVALMVDSNLGTGAADPADRERTKQAYWHISNATKPNQLGPSPVDGYVRIDKANALEDAVIQFVQNVTPTEPPAVTINVPEPGHLYDHGADHTPGPVSDAAVLVGDLAFSASASAECPIEEMVVTTTPDVGWRHESIGNETTTSPFPASSVPEGTYVLNVSATDSVGQERWSTVPFIVQRADPPTFLDPSPCLGSGTVAGTSHQALTVEVAADTSLPTRNVSLSLIEGPTNLSLSSTGPSAPVTGTLSWPDPQVGTFDVTVRATDDHGLTTDCAFSLAITNPPPVAGFSYAPSTPDEDTLVSFTDQSSDANGVLTAWNWSFGDGTTTTETDPAHAFEPGSRDVCLTVTDDDGATDAFCDTLTISDVPAPDFDGPSCGPTPLAAESHQAFTQGLQASSTSSQRTVDLALVFGPSGLSLASDGPANPVNATLSWPDPVVGSHDLLVRASDSQGESRDCSLTIDVTNPPPTAAFHLPADPVEDHGLSFTDASTDSNGQVVAWDWDLGDGNRSTVQDPSHTYADPGTYMICLTVTDDDGATDTACSPLPVAERILPAFDAPTACSTGTATGTSHQPLSVPAEASSADANRTVTIELVAAPTAAGFTGGGPANPSTATLSWSDPQVGTHGIQLRAVDSEGEEMLCAFDLTITNPAPVADFAYAPATPDEDTLVRFTDNSTDENGAIQAWDWSFGDGATSTATDPSHTFAPGTFDVCLAVTDEDGASAQACRTLSVADVPPPTFTDPDGPTCADGSVPATSHQALTHSLSASSSSSARTVDLSLVHGPTGMALDASGPANPVDGSLSWSDPQLGLHDVVVRATDSQGETTDCTFQFNVTNPAPVADFSYAPATPDEDTAVQLTDNSSDQNGQLVAWDWSFGDGTTSSEPDPVHTFAPGTFDVCLTVTDDDGASATTCRTLAVADVPPPTFQQPESPSCTGGALAATSHVAVSVDLSANSTKAARTVELALVQGPTGLALETDGPANPVHGTLSWNDPQVGLHDVLVRATDSQGEARDCALQFNVTNPTPVAAFSYVPAEPDEDSSVSFTDASTDDNGQVVTWDWAFGDGSTSAQTNPSHPFEPGTFDVCLTVADDDGATDTTCQALTVSDVPPPVFTDPEGPTCAGDPVAATSHQPLVVAISATSSHTRTATLGLVGGPSGLTLASDGPSNPVNGTLSWNDPSVGLHDVVVRATDSRGETTDCALQLNVTNPAPVADFTIAPEGPDEDALVQFTDASSDENGEVTGWNWTFGDGTTSTATDPAKTFGPGTFEVCLRATDDDGANATTCKPLTVSDVSAPTFQQPDGPTCTGTPVAGTSHVALLLDLVANSTKPTRTVDLTLVQAPAGASLSTNGPSNPVSGTLTWNDPTLGVHDVVVRATDSEGETRDCDLQLNVTNPAPMANPSFAPATLDEDTPVQLTDNSSDANGPITSWSWDLGDGTTSTEAEPVHSFAAGTFEVCLTVTDQDGADDTACQTLTVADIPPPGFQPDTLCSGGSAAWTSHVADQLDLSASSTGTSRTLTLELRQAPSGVGFTSDGPANPVSGTLSWSDPIVGVHNVVVRATDSQGELTDCTFALNVTNPPPEANFTYAPLSPDEDTSVRFTDASTDENGHIVDRDWAFGDGATSTRTNPSHSFAPGTFQVCLTVTDDDGANATTCKPVTAADIPPPAFEPGVCNQPDALAHTSGQPLSVPVNASSASTRTITLALVTGPSGLSLSSDGPANPVHGALSWASPAAGTFDVLVRATDSQGETSDCAITLEVVNPAPVADFLVVTSDPVSHQPVQFRDASGDENGFVDRWRWTMGDGAERTATDPSHIFAGPGTYTVCLTVWDNEGAASAETCKDVAVGNPPPVVAFRYLPGGPDEDTLVNFTDESTDENGHIASWAWDFGDGATSTLADPSHRFDPGTFDICLTVTDNDGASNSTCQALTVGDIPPPAFSPDTLCSGATLSWTSHVANHTNLSANSTGQRLVELTLLSAPRGVSLTSDGPANPVHGTIAWTDPKVGLFDVVVRATDSQGESTDCRFELDVTNPGPEANFTYAPSAPDEDTLVNFTDNSSDANGHIASWAWRFGDGVTSSATDPSHTFGPGPFEVCLTVTDADGATDLACTFVSVADIPPPAFSPETLCSGATLSWTSHVADSVSLSASSSSPDRTVSLALVEAPSGVQFTSDGPANPVSGTLSWSDPQVGLFDVVVRATDSQGETADCPFTLAVTNPAPVADFDHAPLDPTEDIVVQFNDTSIDENGPIVAWSWDFGDGATSTATDPTHQFVNGTFDVCLTVTDQDNATDTTCKALTIADVPPPTFSPDTLCDGGTADTWTSQVADQLALSASSTSPSRTITLELITAPAGMVLDSNGPANPVEGTLSWPDPATGTHDVLVRATDSQGETRDCPFTIEVVNPAPVADFLVGTSDPVSHQPVQFLDNASDTNGRVVAWRWTFGDGNTSTATDPSHTFGAPATFEVCLVVTDDEGRDSARTCKDVIVGNPAPVAAFSYVPASPDEDTLVSFTDASTDANGHIVSGDWSFGDSATSTDPDPTHQFAPGTHEVCLTVTDNDGATDTACKSVTVADIEPPAFSPDTLCDGTGSLGWISHVANSTALSASSSSPNRTVSLALVQAPAGMELASTGPANLVEGTLSWDDPQVGGYDVMVRATDARGESSDCPFTVDVTNPPPVANFTWAPPDPDEDTVVQFTDTSTDENGHIVAWDWSFGDGGTSTDANTTHQFTPGPFDVCLTVTDNDGATDTTCEELTVADIGPPTFSPDTLCTGDPAETWTSHVADQLTLSATSGGADRTVTLALLSAPRGAALTSDGPANPVTGALSWTDPQAGTHDVLVRATDSRGESTDCPFQLEVVNVPPEANFTWTPQAAVLDQPVKFTDLSTDENGEVVSWSWDFGNGETSSVPNPTTVFSATGAFEACLTVTDDDGDRDEGCKTVHVGNYYGHARMLDVLVANENSDQALVSSQLVDTTRVRQNTTLGLLEPLYENLGLPTVLEAGNSTVTVLDGQLNVTSMATIGQTVLDLPTGQVLEVRDLVSVAQAGCGGARTALSLGSVTLDGAVVFEGAELVPERTVIELPNMILRLNQAQIEAFDGGHRASIVGVEVVLTLPPETITVQLGFTESVMAMCDLADVLPPPPCTSLCETTMLGRALGLSLPPEVPVLDDPSPTNSTVADTGNVETRATGTWQAHSPAVLVPGWTNTTIHSTVSAEPGATVAEANVTEYEVEVPAGTLYLRHIGARAEAQCGQPLAGNSTIGVIEFDGQPLDLDREVPPNTAIPVAPGTTIFLNRQMEVGNTSTVVAVEIVITTIPQDPAVNGEFVRVAMAEAGVDGCPDGTAPGSLAANRASAELDPPTADLVPPSTSDAPVRRVLEQADRWAQARPTEAA